MHLKGEDMAFTILTDMAQPGDDVYYDPKFRLIAETHMVILRQEDISRQQIDLDLFYQYEGNFYGYLVEIGVQPELHWLYMRVNGMTNPNQFAKEVRDPYGRAYSPVLIRPNDNIISGLVQYYMSRKFK
jgi:hypothetical protein